MGVGDQGVWGTLSQVVFDNASIYGETKISGICVTMGVHFEHRRIPLIVGKWNYEVREIPMRIIRYLAM